MRFLGEQNALDRLGAVRSDLRSEIMKKYEHRAQNCLTCKTQGACCLDAHFVNVHISRLEAVAIRKSLQSLPLQRQQKVNVRIHETIDKYALTTEGDTFAQTYACPLFEKGTGCIVHHDAKPVPCVVHACYDNADDLPPDDLLERAEEEIEILNMRTYGRSQSLLPLPLALS